MSAQTINKMSPQNRISLWRRTLVVFGSGALIGMSAALSSSLVMAAPQPAKAEPCTLAQLQGSWELQSAIYRDGQGKVVAEIKDQQTKSRKLIAGHYFSFITWQADGKFEVAASGTIKVDVKGYHEQVDTTSLARLQGKTFHFACQISGDQWLHQGLEDGIQIEEHWLRLALP